MSFKSFASPIALAAAAALSLGSAAFAQNMIGDQEISDEDLAAVRNHCSMLIERGEVTMPNDAMAPADGAAADDMAPEGAMDAEGAAADDMAPDDGMDAGDAAEDDAAPPDAGGVVDDSIPTEDDVADDAMTPNDDGTAGIDFDAITLEQCEAANLGEPD